ncbi:MAG: endonuclease MutS2, partial [Alistipes sp.]|nr:endonuclease MutS2 [Alistipes sp.]
MRRSVELLAEQTFSTSARTIATRQALAAEMGSILSMDCGVLKDEFFDIDTLVEKIRIEGTFLDCGEVMRLGTTLSAAEAVVEIIRGKEQFKALNRLSSGVVSLSHITREIARILDERGDMRDNASPELAAVRREIRQSEGQVSKRLQAVLQGAKSAGIVDADALISIRDGRAVIPVSAANKRKLQGFIHDESATGKTFYIEPVEVVELNNRLKELEYTERREVVKILTAFTDLVRIDVEAVAHSGEFVAQVDMIRAKARWAAENDAVQPIISNGELWLVKARHPLLAQTLKRNGRELIPLDARLDKDSRILVISGPNAGGKSVCLKTFGILQYMFQ